MQHFNASAFIALKPAKAKATALAMFAAAQIEAMPDWHAVALALHAAYSPKPRTPKDETAMGDSADAGEFAPWNDLPAPGKGTAMIRGRVSVEFADGYSKTIGLVAGKGKPWSIGKAVAFAVACYQSDAARRMTGGDEVLYCGEHLLPNLIAVPEIVSVISAESDHTAAGDLVWSPDAANAATREMRAGQIDPATYVAPGSSAPEFGSAEHPCELLRARFEIGRRIGLMKSGAETHMVRENIAAHHRALALLFPFPHRAMELGNSDRQELEELFDKLMPAAKGAAIEVAQVEEADPRPEMADYATQNAASEIVDPEGPNGFTPIAYDDWSYGLSAVSFRERFLLVEDALLGWPAMMEPCAFVDGERVDAAKALVIADGWEIGPHGKWINPARNDGAAYVDTPRAFRNIVEDYKLGSTEAGRPEDESAPPAAEAGPSLRATGDGHTAAALEAVAEPAPRVKPRYRFMADGSYQIVTEG